MLYYKPVKLTINAPGLVEIIIDMVVGHYGLADSIATIKCFLFISKFWSLLCYFLGIKQRLSNIFHLLIDDQTKWQKSIMEPYLRAFVNFKQNDQARLLPVAKFPYYNAKNASTDHMLFELNCSYHPRVFFKKDTNARSWSKKADKLSAEL